MKRHIVAELQVILTKVKFCQEALLAQVLSMCPEARKEIAAGYGLRLAKVSLPDRA